MENGPGVAFGGIGGGGGRETGSAQDDAKADTRQGPLVVLTVFVTPPTSSRQMKGIIFCFLVHMRSAGSSKLCHETEHLSVC